MIENTPQKPAAIAIVQETNYHITARTLYYEQGCDELGITYIELEPRRITLDAGAVIDAVFFDGAGLKYVLPYGSDDTELVVGIPPATRRPVDSVQINFLVAKSGLRVTIVGLGVM